MTNRYPLWKNLLILIVVLCGFYYAAPNLYAPDPALQIAGASLRCLVLVSRVNRRHRVNERLRCIGIGGGTRAWTSG